MGERSPGAKVMKVDYIRSVFLKSFGKSGKIVVCKIPIGLVRVLRHRIRKNPNGNPVITSRSIPLLGMINNKMVVGGIALDQVVYKNLLTSRVFGKER